MSKCKIAGGETNARHLLRYGIGLMKKCTKAALGRNQRVLKAMHEKRVHSVHPVHSRSRKDMCKLARCLDERI